MAMLLIPGRARGVALARLALSLVLAGCFFDDQSQIASVPSDPFGQIPIPPGQRVAAKTTPSSFEQAKRVDVAGYGVLAANPQLSFHPLFTTIGAPEPEIFHSGTAAVVITEGLTKQCKTNAQLAAVLCTELAKMAAEKEALTGPGAKAPDRAPPMEVRVGNDGGGSFGPADQVHHAELAKYEQEFKQKAGSVQPGSSPDVQALARDYLTKAGYAATELDAVAPLLRTAADNRAFAERLAPPPPAASPR